MRGRWDIPCLIREAPTACAIIKPFKKLWFTIGSYDGGALTVARISRTQGLMSVASGLSSPGLRAATTHAEAAPACTVGAVALDWAGLFEGPTWDTSVSCRPAEAQEAAHHEHRPPLHGKL